MVVSGRPTGDQAGRAGEKRAVVCLQKAHRRDEERGRGLLFAVTRHSRVSLQ